MDRDLSESPSYDEFKIHFESLVNLDNQPPCVNVGKCPYLPVLDDPLTPMELEVALNTCKNNGYVGGSTGLFKMLPATVLFYITQKLNIVFTYCFYKLHIYILLYVAPDTRIRIIFNITF